MHAVPAAQAPVGEDGEAEEEHEEEGGPARRLDWFAEQRAYPLTSLPKDARLKALSDKRRMISLQATASEHWVNIGPAPMRDSIIGRHKVSVSGRTTALAVDPRNSSVIYLGAAQGGVWKSTDDGASWTPLTDDQPSLAVGALTLDPRNPDVVWVGTGEPHFSIDRILSPVWGYPRLSWTQSPRTLSMSLPPVPLGHGVRASLLRGCSSQQMGD
jgi:hypothetical protein